ncbi:MAG TPA: dolichyl-phosphate beta-glucosyltransferase [Anaerolineaceae bacterium]
MTKPFLSLVFPAHNEESRLPATLEQTAEFLKNQAYDSEIIVVENGSSDCTLAIARQFVNQIPNLQVIHEDRRGKGLAVRTGMLAATGEYRMFLDVDLSMPISEVNRFIPPILPRLDVAIASREVRGAVRYGEPYIRHIVGRGFNLLVRLLALPGLQDSQCGFKCFRGQVADELFARQTIDGWTFDVEVLFIARKRGYTISEIPIAWYYYPQSKMHVMQASFRMFADLWAIRRNGWQGKYG